MASGQVYKMYTNRGSTSWSSGGAGDDTSSYSFDYDYLFDANQQHPAAHDYYSSWSSAWAPSANAYFSEFPTINPGDLGWDTFFSLIFALVKTAC